MRTDRQQQIVDLAVKIIAKDGVQALTMHRLAKDVGVTEPALYRHFKNKRAILESVIDMFGEIVETITRVDDSLRGLDRMEALVMRRFHMFVANPELTKVMSFESNFQFDQELSQRMLSVIHGHRATFAESLAEAQRLGQAPSDIPVTHLFHVIIGGVRLLVTRWCLSGFSFDLLREGESLWRSQRKLIEG